MQNFMTRLGIQLTKGRAVVVRAMEFGPGAIAVESAGGRNNEFDLYFDPELWEFTMPEIWGEMAEPSKEGICVLTGYPHAKDFAFMKALAHDQVRPVADAKWCEHPRLIAIPGVYQPAPSG